MSASGVDRNGEPLKNRPKKKNTFSRTTLLEKKVAALEEAVNKILLQSGTSELSIEDNEEEKRLRALREKGAIKYGD